MDQRSASTRLCACDGKRCRLGRQERENDSDARDTRRHEPDQREVAVSEHGLADQRTDRDPEIQRQRQEAQCLAATAQAAPGRWRPRAPRRGRTPRPHREATRASTRTPRSTATRWRTIPATVSTAPPTSSGRRPNRSDDQPTIGRRASDAIAKEANTIADRERVAGQPLLDESRRDGEDDPAGDVEREGRRREDDERSRDEARSRPVRCGGRGAHSSSNRSAAAYGSRRCSATSSRVASVAARMRRVVESLAQPVRDDRPDLRLGTGEARRR